MTLPFIPPPKVAPYQGPVGTVQRSLFTVPCDGSAEPKPKLVVDHLSIHSADRDQTLYPNPNKYQIKLSDTCGAIKNLKSIQLVGGAMPGNSNVTSQPFLLLCIDELTRGDHIRSTNSTVQKAYAFVQPDHPLQDDAFFQLKADWFAFAKVEMGGTLDHLTISIKAADGTLFPYTAGQDHHLFFVIERYV